MKDTIKKNEIKNDYFMVCIIFICLLPLFLNGCTKEIIAIEKAIVKVEEEVIKEEEELVEPSVNHEQRKGD